MALYPDPLLAQVLAASTFADQLTGAARWAEAHRKLSGEPLAAAMRTGSLSFDPTVETLLPFPALLRHMAEHLDRSRELGDAVLEQQKDVLEAVQRLRARAEHFGNLVSDAHLVVKCPPCSILLRNPAYVIVPSYDPDVVFARRAANAARTIRFESEVNVGGFEPYGFTPKKFEVLGSYFQAWGWGRGGIDWSVPNMVINHEPWGRNWANRLHYEHSYPDLQRTATAAPGGGS